MDKLECGCMAHETSGSGIVDILLRRGVLTQDRLAMLSSGETAPSRNAWSRGSWFPKMT